MTKTLSAGLLSLAAVAFAAPTASAGTFGLFTCGGCGCCKGCCFCVRPYNAFSPVACGSVCMDGCVGGGNPGGYGGNLNINYMGIPCDGACAMVPAAPPTVVMAPPQAPQAVPQAPQLMPQAVQPAGYYPGYYPGYNYPAQPMPMPMMGVVPMGNVPHYWNQ